MFRQVDASADAAALIHVGDSDPLEASYCKRVVDGRIPEVINDAQALPEVSDLAATKAVGVGAHLSVPIRLTDGEIYGIQWSNKAPQV